MKDTRGDGVSSRRADEAVVLVLRKVIPEQTEAVSRDGSSPLEIEGVSG